MPNDSDVCPCCRLHDHKHKLISGCNIALVGITQGSLLSRTTNDDGILVFTLLSPGNYTVGPKHEGINRDKSRDVSRNVKRARTAFRRLANGAFALAGLAAAAFLTVLASGKLSFLPAFSILSVALSLSLVGFFFHLQADIFEIEDTR